MSEKITIYQKPTCSKCRATLEILKENGEEFESINYYENPITVETLRELVQKLDVPLKSILRKGELPAAELVGKTDEELMELMVNNPDLIQRPIVVRGDTAKLCRPPENVKDFLK